MKRLACCAALAALGLAGGALARPYDEALTAGAYPACAPLDPTAVEQGLRTVRIKGLQLACVKPDASLADYVAIQIDPVSVAFSKDWNPLQPGSRLPISGWEREKVRAGVADLVHASFVSNLTGANGYALAQAAGPHVLRLKLTVADLYVAAPDVPTANLTFAFTRSAGQGTLVAELYDAATGELLARVVDKRDARTQGYPLRWTYAAYNEGEGERVADEWARRLGDYLQGVRAAGK